MLNVSTQQFELNEGSGETTNNAGQLFKNTYSTLLLLFCITIIMGLIFTEQTSLSSDVHPALACVVIWIAVLWLSYVEGGQASFVGLAPVNRELYKTSHPIAYKCSRICHRGDSLDRYLLGRQFMVIFIVFIINLAGAPHLDDAKLWGFPTVLTDIFLTTGLAMIFFTAMVGQLASQVNASQCMLDYCNDYCNLGTLYVANMVEFSGLVHASYIVQMLVARLAGQTKLLETTEDPPNKVQSIFFWFRCVMSLTILGFCLAVTVEALFQGQTTMWAGVPGAVSVILFLLLMCIVGNLEGMQIAFFAVAKVKEANRGTSRFAKMTCEVLFRGEGRNLPAFMIGRQLCVVACFFVIARVTTLELEDDEPNIFGVSDSMQKLFETGLLGAVITTIIGSISWQLVASAFPIAFLSSPFTYFFLRICLALEWTGIASGSWVLASIHRRILGLKRDEFYIGTAEEREDNDIKDDTVRQGLGHPRKLPGFADNAPKSLKALLMSDPKGALYLDSILAEEENEDGEEENDGELELMGDLGFADEPTAMTKESNDAYSSGGEHMETDTNTEQDV